jgi:hypothetical protein
MSLPAFADPQEKVDICHFDMDYGVWVLISISGNAVDMHFNNHDDGFPGGETVITFCQVDELCIADTCDSSLFPLSESELVAAMKEATIGIDSKAHGPRS